MLAVVVVALVGGGVLWYEYMPGGPRNPYRVDVSEVNWLSDGSEFASSAGFDKVAGTHVRLTLTLTCDPGGFFGDTPETCTSGSVFLETAGFGLVATDAPFTWSSGDSGSSETLVVTVSTPSSAFSGNLTINLQ